LIGGDARQSRLGEYKEWECERKKKQGPRKRGARRVERGSVASRRGGKINGGHKWGARLSMIAALSKTKRGGGTLSIKTDNDQILYRGERNNERTRGRGSIDEYTLIRMNNVYVHIYDDVSKYEYE
jgi:hypothetical protein